MITDGPFARAVGRNSLEHPGAHYSPSLGLLLAAAELVELNAGRAMPAIRATRIPGEPAFRPARYLDRCSARQAVARGSGKYVWGDPAR